MEYSTTVMYKNASSLVNLIYSLSPNPIGKPGHLMLKFNADKRGKLHAKILDTQGKVILKTVMEAFVGMNNGHFHLGDVPPGTYTR
jgi:hypothetical protein